MELFRRNKREKPDIEFITKAKLKKLELHPKKKNSGVGHHFMPHLISEEPRRQTRWLAQIPTERGVEEYWCSFARPTMSQDRHEIPYMSTTTWSAGSVRWDDLYLEFRDVLGSDFESGQGLTEWFRTITESTITGRQGYGGGFKKNITVESLDPTGVTIEKWSLVGCMPTELQYHQELDDMDPIIGVNFSIDRAILLT
jgi:hypothetical protein